MELSQLYFVQWRTDHRYDDGSLGIEPRSEELQYRGYFLGNRICTYQFCSILIFSTINTTSSVNDYRHVMGIAS